MESDPLKKKIVHQPIVNNPRTDPADPAIHHPTTNRKSESNLIPESSNDCSDNFRNF